MRLFRHKKFQTIFKGILLLLYLALFGSQLSVKFYERANFLSRSFRKNDRKPANAETAIPRCTSLANHEGGKLFHLNKRYEFKQLIGLFAAGFQLKAVECEVRNEFSLFRPLLSHSYLSIPSLRAPPAA